MNKLIQQLPSSQLTELLMHEENNSEIKFEKANLNLNEFTIPVQNTNALTKVIKYASNELKVEQNISTYMITNLPFLFNKIPYLSNYMFSASVMALDDDSSLLNAQIIDFSKVHGKKMMIKPFKIGNIPTLTPTKRKVSNTPETNALGFPILQPTSSTETTVSPKKLKEDKKPTSINEQFKALLDAYFDTLTTNRADNFFAFFYHPQYLTYFTTKFKLPANSKNENEKYPSCDEAYVFLLKWLDEINDEYHLEDLTINYTNLKTNYDKYTKNISKDAALEKVYVNYNLFVDIGVTDMGKIEDHFSHDNETKERLKKITSVMFPKVYFAVPSTATEQFNAAKEVSKFIDEAKNKLVKYIFLNAASYECNLSQAENYFKVNKAEFTPSIISKINGMLPTPKISEDDKEEEESDKAGQSTTKENAKKPDDIKKEVLTVADTLINNITELTTEFNTTVIKPILTELLEQAAYVADDLPERRALIISIIGQIHTQLYKAYSA